jgi:hypothetical protein
MKTIVLELEDRRGVRPLEFTAANMVNLGYVGRDAAAVRHHIDELAKEGVPPPVTIPMRIPMPLSTLSIDEQIDVSGEKTSGEVEIAFLLTGGKTYVGIGSDHTDREIERQNMALSKQVCPNVLGQRVWDFEELKAVWDELVIQSWVSDDSGREVAYQRNTLKAMLPPQTLIKCGHAALRFPGAEGLVIYSGTIGLLNSQFMYSPSFRCELSNPASGRKLSCQYSVRTLTSIFQS